MNDDQTPINANARPPRRPPEALEHLSLALREHLIWPIGDRLLGLGNGGRAVVAGGGVALALGLGVGTHSLSEPDGSEPVAATVAVAPQRSAPVSPAPSPQPKPEPTLQGATPVLKPPADDEQATVGEGEGVEGPAADTSAKSGDPATDAISTSPAPTASGASASTSAATATVDGPPAGPAAIAVAHKFADAFVVYETGGEDTAVRKALGTTATPELARALLRRPPRQPAGIEVPKAKVLNIVPAPSHGKIYPLSVSLLRIGTTSELRVEMEHLKDKGWRVTNVLG
jgi:hypothetical protein